MTDLRKEILAARELHRSGGGTVFDILLRTTGCDETELDRQLRRQAGVGVLSAKSAATPDFSSLDRVLAKRLGAVAFTRSGCGDVVLGMSDPWNEESVRECCDRLGVTPELVALPGQILLGWIGSNIHSGGASHAQAAPASRSGDGIVVKFVDDAIRAAMQGGASDIHFECDRTGVTVKLRQDGVMARFARLDDSVRAEEVVSRIKVLAQLDITERRTPQDGRFRYNADAETSIDLRVSIMPSVHGEDAVLRLLDKAQLRSRNSAVSLDALGFGTANADVIRDLALLPHGMLLVTGPTGSGKTTTVYAVLSEINTGLEKIITIEDPVEYELPGVLQIPVNERKGLTFAKGLRSILRHDPDRILVGEIRDAETAEIAVQSALTGHQVFTTVHANSVFDVTGRFRHFDLDMFGFMSALNGVIVQRLLRSLCPLCVGERPATDRERRWLETQGVDAARVAVAAGCEACRGSGFRGRVVLAEVHVIDDIYRDLIASNSSLMSLREHVSQSGVSPLATQAARMILERLTTPEEIKRVVGWN